MPAELTPMMRQYMKVKEKYSDCILFYRLGDFYEMFFEDALLASRELEIVLTGRDCGLAERAPMCGVPFHSALSYVERLIQRGHKVAICEQLTDPKDSKGLVERDVIRVITPGTVIEENMLSESRDNYIVSLFLREDAVGIAYCDVSTGSFSIMELSGERLDAELLDEMFRLQPTELIVNEALCIRQQLYNALRSDYFVECGASLFLDAPAARERLLSHFKVASLGGFGCEELTLAISAAGALITYLEETQKNSLSHIKAIKVNRRSLYMTIDSSSRVNLELTSTIRSDGKKNSTLLHLMDRTGTAMGARMLRRWIDQPLQDIHEIERRLEAVAELNKSAVKRGSLIKLLGGIYDIERLCSRIAYGSVNARDCVALMNSIAAIAPLREALNGMESRELCLIARELDGMEDLYALLSSAIEDDPPLSVKEGGIIRTGYDSDVDNFRSISKNAGGLLLKFESEERERTGIKNLKTGFNKVFGYYIEVTKSYQHLVPYTYQRKQTLANCERYVTDYLKELEGTILGAQERCIAREYELFTGIREVLEGCISRLQSNAGLIATLDVYCAFSRLAFEQGYCRPKLNNTGRIEISDGRHPVVELNLKDGFVPNHTRMNSRDDRLLIITGPNMAGKSTYMRQVALITLMAHIGSFVPAAAANISITDRIFTRIGASDSLAAGKSTFMVEMSEMANILHNATDRSLLIIDEIGRGTSTFDGLSIAWSVIEHIADRSRCGAKTLFATHYHELTELEGKLAGVKNYRVSVKEVGEDIIFLRRIVRGGADKSFGIQVARLAGLPGSVIERAKEILKELEESSIGIDHAGILSASAAAQPEQITLFGSPSPNDIMQELRDIDINTITPMEALNRIYDLHIRAKLR